MTQPAAASSQNDVASRRRARAVAGVAALLFCVLVGRTAQIASAPGPVAQPQSVRAETLRRADIVDRKGKLLATSLTGYSLFADPRAIWEPEDVAKGVASVLGDVDVEDLTRRLSDRTRAFVWIKRGLTPRQREQVRALGLEGLGYREESRRVYPGGRLAGHLLGFTNVDGKGAEGLEAVFDGHLSDSRNGALRLTIDAGVQYALEAELDYAAEAFTMKGAAGVVIEARTGAVRAIASWPHVDPNRPGEADADARLNRAQSAVFELGSVFKPLTVAAAFDSALLRPDETFDIRTPLQVGAATVRDHDPLPHPQAVTAADIIAFSSNIGTAQIAGRMGPERQRAFLESVGLLGRVESDGPTTAAPLTPAEWDDLTAATVSYGHGLAVTPLAFAMAFTPFANDGEYVAPAFLEPVDPSTQVRRRVMSAPTARYVLSLLRECVTRGTGRNAEATGYEVAGKTGTAEKPGPDGYDPNRNITSFAAVFPASRPEFVVLIVLDEAQPRTGQARTAAWTAAAIAGRLIARAASLLEVEPVLDAPAEPLQPEIRAVSETRAL